MTEWKDDYLRGSPFKTPYPEYEKVGPWFSEPVPMQKDPVAWAAEQVKALQERLRAPVRRVSTLAEIDAEMDRILGAAK